MVDRLVCLWDLDVPRLPSLIWVAIDLVLPYVVTLEVDLILEGGVVFPGGDAEFQRLRAEVRASSSRTNDMRAPLDPRKPAQVELFKQLAPYVIGADMKGAPERGRDLSLLTTVDGGRLFLIANDPVVAGLSQWLAQHGLELDQVFQVLGPEEPKRLWRRRGRSNKKQ
jgi:hypothetical protein